MAHPHRSLPVLAWLISACTCPDGVCGDDVLAREMAAILERPELRSAHVAACFAPLDGGPPIYSLEAEKRMVPGSVTKLVTAGTALALLGRDHRFRTTVHATGPVRDGVLEGDLVLVASGDPNLSGRLRADGTLAFTDMDHAYANVFPASAVEGDPLTVLRDLARQVAARGIHAVRGSVRVDAHLFPEGAREHGSGVTISPIALNDNVVDVFLAPGAAVGEPARLRIAPETTYTRFVNATTTMAEGPVQLTFDAQREEDGSFTVTASGSASLAASERLFAYAVETPCRFAEHAFAGALREAGVDARVAQPGDVSVDVGAENDLVAEHVSAPFSEAVKVMLKVSQNLHAAVMPYLVGAELGDDHDTSDATGFERMGALLTDAGLDLSEAAQSDGEGGPGALFSARFMTRFLVWMARGDEFPAFEAALPVLARDGTLAHTLRDSPMAGKLRAKTGTLALGNALGGGYVIMGKGLAGYLTTASGRRVAFAVFANHISTPPEMESILRIGDDLAEMAEAVYRRR